ncbi:Imm1 family immunity protein [Actinosynnema sp. NPDC059335]|uniref:Imm1 family immunity protein n=1 Tax=Actinosynnema sp. NPDC059335 TaxID=3346804 RepID=UPI00366BDFB6
MKIEARWADLEPGTVLKKQFHEEILGGRAEVELFVQRLARPDTGEAYLLHPDRPRRTSSFDGRSVPDHKVVVAVRDAFGYMEFSDDDHFCQSLGSPESPGWTTTASDYFHPGTGVSLSTLVDLIDEFRTTAARPTAVRWRDALGE